MNCDGFELSLLHKLRTHTLSILKYSSCKETSFAVSVLKLSSGFMPLFSTYTQHPALPQVPLGQIVSVMCQRAGRESLLVHQRPCHADLKSQMRSQQGNNGELSPSTRAATFLHMLREPRTPWVLVRQSQRKAPRERK